MCFRGARTKTYQKYGNAASGTCDLRLDEEGRTPPQTQKVRS